MELRMMAQVMGMALTPAALTVYAPALAVLIYLLVTWDARREGSANAADTQIGLKVIIHLFAILGILIAAGGVQGILGFILGKIKGGAPSAMIKLGIANLMAGGGTFFACWQVLLPRTNWTEHTRVTRLSYGVVAGMSGIFTIAAATSLLGAFITNVGWGFEAPLLASLAAFAGLAVVSIGRLGAMSGWVAPPPKATGFAGGAGGGYDPNQPQQGYPPQPQQGYPPQPQQGYPPQGGGVPPAGGGYPPQGGGVPPAGGGYPPQGGGNY